MADGQSRARQQAVSARRWSPLDRDGTDSLTVAALFLTSATGADATFPCLEHLAWTDTAPSASASLDFEMHTPVKTTHSDG